MKKLLLNKFKVTIYSILLVIAVLLNSANAQNNSEYFYAKYSTDVKIVYFFWQFNYKVNENSNFVIWHAEGALKEFTNSDFKEYYKLTYKEAASADGMFYYKVPDGLDLSIDHTYCLQTIEPDGTTKFSNVFILDINGIDPPPQGFEFTVFPAQDAFKNKEYVSSIKAVYIPEKTKTVYYKLLQAPKGMTINSTTGEIRWTPSESSYENVSVRAYLPNTDNAFTDYYFTIFVRKCENPIYVKGTLTNKYDELVKSGFIMLIPKDMMMNDKPREQMYSEVIDGKYEFKADGGEYYLYFYDVTGRTFIYESAQTNSDAKIITLDCGKDITLDWKISNYSDRTFNLSGKVLDRNGKPLPDWNVFFQTNSIDKMSGYFGNSTLTDENGNYSIDLPEDIAVYAYINTDFNDFNKYYSNTIYYKQTFDITKAEILKITSDIKGIDFQIIDNPDFKYFVVSGQVMDENNKPLPRISVAFEGFAEQNDKNQYYKYYDQVVTDENGKYAIKLPSLFKYVAYAVNAYTQNGYTDKYMPLFYKQTYYREKATILTLESDLSGIDFVFKPYVSDYKGYVIGNVVDESNTPISFAFVEAINVDADNNINNDYRITYGYTDDAGNFTIKGLKTGKYILFASTQHSKEFMCGYYVANAVATINFEEASQVKIGDAGYAKGITIILPKFTGKGEGKGIIKGKIYNQSNYSESNKDNSAINSAKIYVKEDANDAKSLASFQNSNADGSFVISGLDNGEYNFVIEKTGFKPYQRVVDVSIENPTDLGLIMLEPMTLGITEPGDMNSQVFPNPTSNSVNLNFVSTSNEAYVYLYGVSGNLVKVIRTDVKIGDNLINISVSDLSNGTYIAVISDGKNKSAVSVVIQR